MKLLNSLQFQLYGVVLSLLPVFAFFLMALSQAAIGSQNAQHAIELVDLQRSNAFLLASLARRVHEAEATSELQNLVDMLNVTITQVDQIQNDLRFGDSNNPPIIDDLQLITILDELNTEWQLYKDTLLTFIESDNIEQNVLLPDIDHHSILMFTVADRLVKGRQILSQVSIERSSRIVAIVIVAGIILGIIAILVTRRTVRSIVSLAAITKKIAQGNLSARANTNTIYEIAQVAYAFNNMASTIEMRDEEMRNINQLLEQRVAERTADLEEARDKAVKAQEVAQESAKLKSEFLSTMSHELRTPLNAIEGFTGIMLGGMGIELNERAVDMVQRISSNSKRLLHLINDFLDLSRIESGRLELVADPVSPRQLAEKWQNEVGILATEKELDLVVNVSPDLPDTILGDEDALSKITINLLSNAFKFTHEGSVTLNLEFNEKTWSIIVRDTGIGIPVHAQEYIFDEFRQVDGSSKRLYGGTGLGLALVQKLSRALGGNVTLQSEVNVGSTFIVTLPIQISEAKPQGAIV